MTIRSTSRSRSHRPIVATISAIILVATTASIAHALTSMSPSSSYYSCSSSRGVMATARRSSRTTTSLHYRDDPDEMIRDARRDRLIDVDDEDDDPLSRELRRGHSPDAAMTALATALLPNIALPSSWIKTSEAMENVVGGAGGAGILYHLNEAVSAYHHVGQVASSRDDVDGIDDDATIPTTTMTTTTTINPHRRRKVSSTSSESTSSSSSTFADDVVETARAFVPVVVEFAAVAAIANYFD